MKKGPVFLRTPFMRNFLVWLAAAAIIPLGLLAQSTPPSTPQKTGAPATEASKPTQAKTQVEYDAYQIIVATADPKEKMQLVDRFVVDFPGSELQGAAYQQALMSAQASNDYEKAIEYSRKSVQVNPGDVLALLIVSTWMPERTTDNDPQRDAKFSEAATAAHKLLEVVQTIEKPETQTEDQWKAQLKELNGRPHAALGLIALLKKDYPGAQEEFEKAVSFIPNEPTFYYRLGLAYTYQKKYDVAAWDLAHSVALKGASEKPARDALEALFKAYDEDPAKAGEEDLIKMAGAQEKMPADFSFVTFMESKLNVKPPAESSPVKKF
jgi:tetratricopeptide (TPR) repeat protein